MLELAPVNPETGNILKKTFRVYSRSFAVQCPDQRSSAVGLLAA
jgi:hypothetical protein